MRVARRIAAGLLVAALLWLGGFLWFMSLTERFDAMPPARADGIVVLTGGAGRVERALRLLADGQAERLLISGVGRTEFPELAARAGVDQSMAPRVTLGRAALNTRGNAEETAEWTRDFGVRSVILVTSAYHMPRALGELRRSAPGLSLHPVAVPAAEPVRLRLLAAEYMKFLAAEIGLSRLDSTR